MKIKLDSVGFGKGLSNRANFLFLGANTENNCHLLETHYTNPLSCLECVKLLLPEFILFSGKVQYQLVDWPSRFEGIVLRKLVPVALQENLPFRHFRRPVFPATKTGRRKCRKGRFSCKATGTSFLRTIPSNRDGQSTS